MANFVIVESEGIEGQPVSLIKIGGITLIKRQIETLKTCSINSIFFVYDDLKLITLKDELLNKHANVVGNLRFIPLSNFPKKLGDLKTNGVVITGDFCFFDRGYIKGCIDCLEDEPNKCLIANCSDFTGDFADMECSICENRKGFCLPIKALDDVNKAENYLFSNLTSSTDSWITRKINRKISLSITRRLAKTEIHPNCVTLFNFIIGLMGAFIVAKTGYVEGILGTFLFLVSSILDGCDGELARLKFQKSKLGGYLDVITDNIVHWFLFASITIRSIKKFGTFPYLPFGLTLLISSMVAFILSFITVFSVKQKGRLLFSESRLSAVTDKEEIIDKLANRDFAYLLLGLAVLNRVEWFLIIGGIGSIVFTYLLYRSLRTRGVM